jgi:hypothetical protein
LALEKEPGSNAAALDSCDLSVLQSVANGNGWFGKLAVI